MLTQSQIIELENLKTRLDLVQSKLYAMDRKESNSYTSLVARSFHLGTVGGSGKNVSLLNKRRERELDKSIDFAVVYTKLSEEINLIKAKILYIESGKSESDLTKRKSKLQASADWFKSLKPGDTIRPGNDRINITKVNKKSLITENDCKWSASELIGKEAAMLL